MEETPISALARALVHLRLKKGWSKPRLTAALGFADPKQLTAYETGSKPLSREYLDFLVAPLEFPPEAVDALLFADSLISPPPPEEAASPLALSPEERREIHRATITAGLAATDAVHAAMTRSRKKEKAAAAHQEAEELMANLKTATREERRQLVEVFPEYRSWALAVVCSHESERAAAHKVDEAREWAGLALFIAERLPGEAGWRSRVLGYCWFYLANFRRVANDFDGSDEAFGRAWELWREGAGSDPDLLLAEWRPLDLEASLRREQQRFQEALKLLGQALAISKGDQFAKGRILLKKEHVLEEMGDIEGALGVLADAAPYVESSRDQRQLFALRFNMSDNFCRLERYDEVEELLPQVRELAVHLRNELDLNRVLWLDARLAAGQGRTEEAINLLEQVQRYFTSRELPYDAARVSLDLAVLWLKDGRTAEVQKLAEAMAWIFVSQKIDREALAALAVFCEAARQETATVELTRRVIADFEKARRSASRKT